MISNCGVSSTCLRCESSAAVVSAAAADVADARAGRRAYQTAPTDPAAATIDTTRAAMIMTANGSGRGTAAADLPPDAKRRSTYGNRPRAKGGIGDRTN